MSLNFTTWYHALARDCERVAASQSPDHPAGHPTTHARALGDQLGGALPQTLHIPGVGDVDVTPQAQPLQVDPATQQLLQALTGIIQQLDLLIRVNVMGGAFRDQLRKKIEAFDRAQQASQLAQLQAFQDAAAAEAEVEAERDAEPALD